MGEDGHVETEGAELSSDSEAAIAVGPGGGVGTEQAEQTEHDERVEQAESIE